MAEPKNTEAINDELDLKQLEGASGGSSASLSKHQAFNVRRRKDHAVKVEDEGFQCHGQDCVEVSGLRSNVSRDRSGFDSNNGIDR